MLLKRKNKQNYCIIFVELSVLVTANIINVYNEEVISF